MSLKKEISKAFIKIFKIKKLIYLLYLRKKNIFIHDSCKISKKCLLNNTFSNDKYGKLTINKNSIIDDLSILDPYGGEIKIGENCFIGPHSVLYGHGGLSIGNNVLIATHTLIIPANHKYQDASIPICMQGLNYKGIIIQDDVWIGAGVKILDGTTIGKGSIVGAGSVVNKNIPPFSVVVGVPAKVIKSRQ